MNCRAASVLLCLVLAGCHGADQASLEKLMDEEAKASEASDLGELAKQHTGPDGGIQFRLGVLRPQLQRVDAFLATKPELSSKAHQALVDFRNGVVDHIAFEERFLTDKRYELTQAEEEREEHFWGQHVEQWNALRVMAGKEPMFQDL